MKRLSLTRRSHHHPHQVVASSSPSTTRILASLRQVHSSSSSNNNNNYRSTNKTRTADEWSDAENTTPSTNPHLSSFLNRLLTTAKYSSSNDNETGSSQSQSSTAPVFDRWINQSHSIQNIFSQVDVRFHAVRIPVQRHLAQQKADRLDIHNNSSKKGNSKRKQGSSSSNKTTKSNDENIFDDDDNKLRNIDQNYDFAITPQQEEIPTGEFEEDHYNNTHQQNKNNQTTTTLDASKQLKAASRSQALLVAKKLRQFALAGRKNAKTGTAEDYQNLFANKKRRKKNSDDETPNGEEQQNNNNRSPIPIGLLCRHCRDMREERFCSFLKSTSDKVRARYGGVVADRISGILCRYWINGQKLSGLSFPSSETAYSPLLPTMLFFSASRDPELFKKLIHQIDQERGRFSSSSSGSGGGGGGGASSDSSSKQQKLGRFGISSFSSSTMPGWIAAVSVTIETALPVLHQNANREQKERKMDRQKKATKDDNDNDNIISDDSLSSSSSGTQQDETTSTIAGEEIDEKKNSNNIIAIATEKLKDLLQGDRCFNIHPEEAIRAVLPVVLSTFVPTHHELRFLRRMPSLEVLSFIPGAGGKFSVSSFELWNNFANKFLLSSSSSINRSTNNNSSNNNKNKILSSFQRSLVPPYFTAFMLNTIQVEADAVLSVNNGHFGRVKPIGGSLLVRTSNPTQDHSSLIDELTSSAVAIFIRALKDCAREAASSVGGGSPGAGIAFSLYIRLLRTLSSCGCCAWVMESIVKDCLAVAHLHTSMMLCHVVSISLHHQKAREVLMMCSKQQQQSLTSSSSSSLLTLINSGEDNNTEAEKRMLTLEQHELLKNSRNSGNNSSNTFWHNLHRLRQGENYLLMNNSSNNNTNGTAAEAFPVDFVLTPSLNDLWKTTVEAFHTVHSIHYSRTNNDNTDNSTTTGPCSVKLPQTVLQQLALTRIRSACLELTKNPHLVFKLLDALRQIDDKRDENNNSSSSSSMDDCHRDTDDDGDEFERFLVDDQVSSLSKTRSTTNTGDDELYSSEEEALLWCDPVSVLSIWLKSKQPLALWTETKSASSSPFTKNSSTRSSTDDEAEATKEQNVNYHQEQQEGRTIQPSKKRIEVINPVFGALADISTFVPSPFLKEQESSARLTVSLAEAASEVITIIREKLLVMRSSSSTTTTKNTDEKQETDTTLLASSSTSHHKNNLVLVEEILPSYLEAIATIALTTKNAKWLHDELLELTAMASSNSNSNSKRWATVGVLSKHLTNSVLQKICTVVRFNYSNVVTPSEALLMVIADGVNNNNNNNKNENYQKSEKAAAADHVVLLYALVENLFFIIKTSGLFKSSQFDRILQTEPTIYYTLLTLRKKMKEEVQMYHEMQRREKNDNNKSTDDDSDETLHQHHYHHRPRIASSISSIRENQIKTNNLLRDKAILALSGHNSSIHGSFGTAEAEPSINSSAQFILSASSANLVLSHRNGMCAPPLHSATHRALEQSAGSPLSMPMMKDLPRARKMGWTSSAIGRNRFHMFSSSSLSPSLDDSSTSFTMKNGIVGDVENNGEDDNVGNFSSSSSLAIEECLTEVIEGFATREEWKSVT